MKTCLVFAAMFCTCIALKAQTKDQPYLTKPLSTESITSATFDATGGSIDVTGVNNAEARLEVFATSNNNEKLSKEEIQKRIDEYYTMNISVSNKQLIVSVKPKHMVNMNWKKSVNISFKAYLPVNVTTDLETSG